MALEVGDKIKLIGRIKEIQYEDHGAGSVPKRVLIKIKLPLEDEDYGGGKMYIDAELAELAKMEPNEPE